MLGAKVEKAEGAAIHEMRLHCWKSSYHPPRQGKSWQDKLDTWK